MNRARRLIMVTMVVSALAADRLAVAAPSVRPQITENARRFASRLVVSLRRIVPATLLSIEQNGRPAALAVGAVIPESPSTVHPVEFSPFYFRLPPPLA